MDEDERELLIAFAHNSCKKISQLAHVLVLLTDARLDRYADERQLFLYQDMNCEAIAKKFTNSNKKIYKELVQFRKKCIQEASDYYGSRFLAMKSKFQNSESEKMAVLNAIEKECQSQIEIIQQIIPFLNNLTKNSSNFSLQDMQNDVNQAMQANQEVNEKNNKLKSIQSECEKIQGDSQNRIKNMTDEHKGNVKLYKRKIKDIKIQKYKNTLLEFKRRITEVNETVNTIRQVMVNHVKNKKKILAPFYKQLQTVMQDLHASLPHNDMSISFLTEDKDFKMMKSKFDDLRQTSLLQYSEEIDLLRRQKNDLDTEFNNKMYQKQQEYNNHCVALQSENDQLVNMYSQRLQVFSAALDAEKNAVNDIISNRKSYLLKIGPFLESCLMEQKKNYQKSSKNTMYDKVEQRFQSFEEDLQTILKDREEMIEEAMKYKDESENDDEEEDYSDDEDPNDRILRKKEKYQKQIEEKTEQCNAQLETLSKQIKTEQTNKKNNLKKEIEHKILINKSKLAEEQEKRDQQIQQHRDEFMASLKDKKIEENENENEEEENEEEEEQLTDEQKMKHYNEERNKLKKELKAIDHEIQNFITEQQKLIQALDNQLKEQLKMKQNFVQNKGPAKVLSDLISQINSDEKSFLSSMPFKSKDQLDIMLQKVITAQVGGEAAIRISEISLMKKHEENTSQIVDTELALEIKMSESPITAMEKKFDSQMTSLMTIIKKGRDSLDSKKSSVKSKWRVKDTPIMNETREMDMKLSVFDQKNENQMDSMREEFEKKKQQMIAKFEASKSRILHQIQQEKQKQQQLIEQNEKEVDNYISQLAEKEYKKPQPKNITFADQIIKLSKKETDLILENFAPSQPTLFVKPHNKIQSAQQKIDDYLSSDNFPAFDMNEIANRKTTQKSSRRARKSALNVLPPLQPL